jgi:hypothetical protein
MTDFSLGNVFVEGCICCVGQGNDDRMLTLIMNKDNDKRYIMTLFNDIYN